MNPLYAAGVDVGSTQTKAIIIDNHRKIVGRALRNTGAHVENAAHQAYQDAVEEAHLAEADIALVLGTGYGRFKITFGADQITEISCHARGAHFFFPETATVIDMGGQDTKAIRVGRSGEVIDFCMNDKCAAGTGRFLEAAASVLGLSLAEIGPRSLEARDPVRLTSTCAVFVESDIMSFLARGEEIPDILSGVHKAIAARTTSLVRRVGIQPEVTFTGGVSRNIAMIQSLENVLEVKLNWSQESHYMGAMGAALFAMERAEASSHGQGEECYPLSACEDGL